jgi:hypothetical protein
MGGNHLALAVAVALGASEPATGEPLKVERFGLYVAAEDVAATARFYERLFGAQPQRTTPVFVGFDVGGGLFAVVSRATYGLQVGSGSRVRPYIRVADVDGAFRGQGGRRSIRTRGAIGWNVADEQDAGG